MAITQAICNSCKQEWFEGIHTSAHTYKIALYTAAATLNASTTAYTTSDEVVGAGYSAGGQNLTGFSVTLDGNTSILDWTTDPSWPASTITARGCLIYNSSASNKAIAVFDYGSNITSTAGLFTVVFPAPAAATGLLRST